jgi:hypothetical protein
MATRHGHDKSRRQLRQLRVSKLKFAVLIYGELSLNAIQRSSPFATAKDAITKSDYATVLLT